MEYFKMVALRAYLKHYRLPIPSLLQLITIPHQFVIISNVGSLLARLINHKTSGPRSHRLITI